MITYLYNKKEYSSLEELRQESKILFPQKPSDEVLKKVGIEKHIIEPTLEEIAQSQLIEAKLQRERAVYTIKVSVNGMVFDGDEISQTRMVRAITASNPGETTNWVLADNSIAVVTREQLQKALKLAGEEQTKLWVIPYMANNPIKEINESSLASTDIK